MTTPDILTRSRELVVPALRKAVGALDPHLRTPAEYHFGWVEPDGTPTDPGTGARPGGKSMRPALVLLGAAAAGAEQPAAVPGAVAIELIHNFSLIHDDIIDGDRTRRHRPSVWAVYGEGDAIIVGDALHTLAFHVLLDDAGAFAAPAVRRLAEATEAMIAGQAQDTALDRGSGCTLADSVEMARNKTAALLRGAVAIGAITGGADAALVSALEHYGDELGLAFQAVDDVLGIWGDTAVTGKPVGNDLREHKKTLPVALALEAGGELAAQVREAFAAPTPDPVVAELAELLAAAGIREQVESRAAAHIDAALGALADGPIAPAVARELEALAHFVVRRDH